MRKCCRCLLLLVLLCSCKQQDKALALEYLEGAYERQENDLWEEGRVYFLPEKPGLQLLPGNKPIGSLKNLKVFRASVWFIHWGPEPSPVLVWIVNKHGIRSVGGLNGFDEITAKFPRAVKRLGFESDEEQRNLALLVGEMVAQSYGWPTPPEPDRIWSEGGCKWAGFPQDSNVNQHIVGSCFSEEGLLERVVVIRYGVHCPGI